MLLRFRSEEAFFSEHGLPTLARGLPALELDQTFFANHFQHYLRPQAKTQLEHCLHEL